MADPKQRDIYHEEERKALPPKEKARIDSDPLEIINEAIRQNRVSLLRFWLIALAFAALIGMVLWQSWQLHNRPQTAGMFEGNNGNEVAGTETNPNAVPTLLDEMPVFPRVDALFDHAPQAIESGSNVIDTARLKTAGRSLVLAEEKFQARDYEEAANLYQTALETIPTLKGVREYLAVCHLQLQQHDKAIDQFSAALRETPDVPSLLNNLGTAHLARGEFAEAAPALNRCVKIRPRYPLAHYNLGWLHTQQEQYADAAHHLKILLDLKPDHFKGLQLYANALLMEQRWGDAAIALKQVVGQISDAASPYFKLAQALGEDGEIDEAIDNLKAGIDLLDLKTARARMDSREFDTLRDHAKFKDLLATLDTKLVTRE